MKPWKRIDPTIVTKIDYFNVVIKTFQMPDDKVATRAIFLADGCRSSSVIAVTKDRKVIVARQFRPGPEEIMDDFPGGFIEEGEDAEETARRELLEEVGYRAGSMEFLGVYNTGTYSNGTIHYFLAMDCERTEEIVPSADADEFIETKLCDIDEFLENAKKNSTTNPAGILLAYDRLKEIQKGEGL